MKLNTNTSISADSGAGLPLLGKVAAAAMLMMASTGAFAILTGTDTNLSLKPASGGMAGASYTKPQEPSAAVFGNPATLTQFSGVRFGIGATYLAPQVEITQSGASALDGGPTTRSSNSQAVDYVVPDVAVTYELGNGWYLGTGIGVNAGAGVDYRTDPITVPSASTDPAITGLPLAVEYLSFNVNFAAAKQLTPQTSVGGALTIGFGLAQLGTVGPSGSFGGLLGPVGCVPATPGSCGFGGTTGSVHDFSAGASLGMTHQLTPTLMLSAAIKSPLLYGFQNAVYTNAPTAPQAGFQKLALEQPLELVAGAAFDIAPNWLIEADVAWKNWSKAKAYQDVYDDQFLLMLGTQYKTGPWSLRAGYSYAEDIMLETPNNTLSGLNGLGPIPLGPLSPVGVDVVKLVQVTIVPIVWNHTVTAGVGYDLNPKVRLDAYGAYAIKNDVTRTTNLGATLSGAPIGSETYRADVNAWAIGAGLNFRF